VEHAPIILIITIAVSLFIGAGLGFLTCALFAGSSAESMLAEIDELRSQRDELGACLEAVQGNLAATRQELKRLTDRDTRGRFVKTERSDL